MPPHLAHTKNSQKGMIMSTMSRNWCHYSNAEDFIRETHSYFQHLMNAGYDPNYLKPIFSEGAQSLERKLKLKQSNRHQKINKPTLKQQSNLSLHQTICYHSTFHPKDISRNASQSTFQSICRPIFRDLLDVKKIIAAHHRPKNPQDILIPSKLRPCQEIECNAEHYLKNTHLTTCAETLNYDEMREEAIAKGLPSLNYQV